MKLINSFFENKKMKIIIFVCLFVFMIGVKNVDAETITAIECEYSDAYKNWLKLSDEERSKVFQPAMCKTNDKFFNLMGNSNVVESYTSTKFDLRDYNVISSMKNQGETNLCWTFATMESIQSNLMLKSNINVDLSEAHLELATQNNLFDSLLPFSRNFDGGGNYFISSAYLMSRIGPVSEESVPFSIAEDTVSNTKTPTLADISNKDVKYVVDDVVVNMSDQGVCNNESITSIKKYLVSNGAMAASMYFEMMSQNFSLDGVTIKDKFLNGQYYYYDGSAYNNYYGINVSTNQSINHAVTIIGWDDTISKDNFSIKPSRDGAWLIKNSYGESLTSGSTSIDLGDKGYYYISYDDINICTSVAGFYNIHSDIEDNIYYYDKLGADSYITLTESTDMYLANIFKRDNSSEEVLDKISFYNFGLNQKYDIFYGTSLEQMSVIYSGFTDRAGVITISVEPISLPHDDFYVGIKFYGNVGNLIPVYYKLDGTFFEMDFDSDISYLSFDGQNWAGFSDGENNYLLPLRIFTSDVDYSFSISDYKIEPNKLSLSVDYKNINDLDKITYNIYNAEDKDYVTNLNDKFNFENNIGTDNNLSINLKENSSEGDYVLVVSYNDIMVKFDFRVVTESGVLKFKVGADEDSDSDDPTIPDFVVDSNPNNDKDDNGDVKQEIDIEDNIKDNPETGSVSIIIVSVIFVGTLICLFYYYRKIRMNNQI